MEAQGLVVGTIPVFLYCIECKQTMQFKVKGLVYNN
jgi:hypothetical protein